MSSIPVREMIKNAVEDLGGKASYKQIIEWITTKYGDVNHNTVKTQTMACSVNRTSRIHLPECGKPRGFDSRYDFLYQTESGQVELYEPAKHGNWELIEYGGKITIAKDGVPILNDEQKSLLTFLQNPSRVYRNYQPIVIKTLLEKGSDEHFSASIDEIKEKITLLNFDREDFEINNAIDAVSGALKEYVVFSKKSVSLNSDYFSDDEIPDCLKICNKEIAKWHVKTVMKDENNIYIIQAGGKGDWIKEFQESKTAGVSYHEIAHFDLTGMSKEEIENKTNGEAVTELYNISQIKRGDIIAVTLGAKKGIENFGIATSGYYFDSISKTYAHRINLEYLNFGAAEINTDSPKAIFKTTDLEKPIKDFLLGLEHHVYFILRHNADSPWDDVEGNKYHFGKTVPNQKKLRDAGVGTKTIWFTKHDGGYYVWGYGTVKKIETVQENEEWNLVYDDFTFFEKQDDSLELEGKFLKKATPEIEQKITNSPGYNNQHSILEISKEIFEDIVDNKKIENNDQYDVGHKLFLIEMNQKEHKTQFIDFNHVDFVNDEVDYKKVILEKSLIELSLDKWDEWISTPEKICQAVRNAVALKISKTLIWAPPFNTEIGYFDELDNLSKVEFGKSLYELFKGSALIEKRFDNFVLSLEKIKRKPDMRLLSYLLFLYDSEKYFPIHPTNFDNLLEFYGFEKIKENSWKKYSQYLELASKLKSFLPQKFSSVELSNIQIQSYMWVIAGAVSKNYWMIRPGTNGEDWKNQRNAGIIGIHYYTIDLSEYAQPNNQLAKRRLYDRMQELRYAEGKEPDSQPALDADFGQFEKIFAIRKKDKIMAIGNNSTLLGIGNATDKYQFRTDVGENCHTIPVDWYDVESREIPKQEIRRTIKKLDIKDYVDIMSSQTTVQKSKYEKFFNILNKKKQFFFYGPPGTGKTFTAKKIAEAFTNQNNSNLENRRHTWKSVTTLVLLENKGLPLNYHEIAKRALEKDLVQTIGETPHETLAKIMREDIQQLGSDSYFIKPSDGIYGLNIPTTFAKAAEVILYAENKPLHYTEITKKAINSQIVLSEGLTPEKSLLAEITKDIQTKGDKSNFIQISNGTYALRKQNPLSNTDIDFNDNFIENVTFHQSYGYEEFVEGIRPSPTENGITYPIEPGIFQKFCEKARNNPKQNYVMIIDEINRGNISKIFGELITIMENDKRETTVTLAYSKKHFSVPSNVYLIGTMNTADRSLVHIDAALKRRFGQYELMPDYSQIDAKIGRVHLGKLLDTLNQKIIAANFRDNQIGHSYFMKDANPITTIEELQFAFAYDIVPLLKDYFYDDDKILHIILGNEFIDKNRNIVTEWTEKESLFMNILEKAYPEAFDKA